MQLRSSSNHAPLDASHTNGGNLLDDHGLRQHHIKQHKKKGKELKQLMITAQAKQAE